MDDREFAPRHEIVRDMANLLLSHRGKDTPLVLGRNWFTNYINHKPELDSRYSRQKELSAPFCEDPKHMQQWLDFVQRVIIHTNGTPSRRYV
jgi:hypothetical protein